jgi:hypothetical protein
MRNTDAPELAETSLKFRISWVTRVPEEALKLHEGQIRDLQSLDDLGSFYTNSSFVLLGQCTDIVDLVLSLSPPFYFSKHGRVSEVKAR